MVIAVGISSFIAITLGVLYERMIAGSTDIGFGSGSIEFAKDARENLSSEEACTASFQGLEVGANSEHSIATIKGPGGLVAIWLGKQDMDQTGSLTGMTLKGFVTNSAAHTGEAQLLMELTKANGEKSKLKEIIITYKTDPSVSRISSCVAKMGFVDDIWREPLTGGTGISFTAGKVGVGTASARTALDVGGALVGGESVSNSIAIIDYATANSQSYENNCTMLSLRNMLDGGTYSLSINGLIQGTCSFSAYSDGGVTALTVHLPPDHGSTTQGRRTLYSFVVVGTHVYSTWASGY